MHPPEPGLSGQKDERAMVRCQSSDGVAIVTLDRPPVNAFSIAMWRSFVAVLDALSDDEDVRAIILTATGSRAFSAGADVREAAGLSPEADQERLQLVSDGLVRLANVPVPVVCAVNGPAVGGGLNVAALCDVRVASESAFFSLPEIDYGRVGGGGAFIRRLGVPAGTIRAMLYLGRRLDATEALAARLVDEVVAPTDLMPRAEELAGTIATKPRSALTTMKAAITAAESSTDWRHGYLAAERSRRAGSPSASADSPDSAEQRP